MRYRLSPLAEQDIRAIWSYVADDASVERADRLVDAIVDRFEMLAEQPRAGRLRPEFGIDVRSFPIENYVIYYQENEGPADLASASWASRSVRRVARLARRRRRSMKCCDACTCWSCMPDVRGRRRWSACWNPVIFAGLRGGRRGDQVEIVTHPLWNTDVNSAVPQLASAYAEATAAGYQVRATSIFEILRRPF